MSLDADKTGPKAAVMFALTMLVATRGGSTYSEQEYSQWLTDAGFVDVQRIRLPEHRGPMIGVRPPARGF